MANNYTEASFLFPVPKGGKERALAVLSAAATELEDGEDGYYGFDADWDEHGPGVWIRHDESLDVEHAVYLVQRLMKEFSVQEPFAFCWAATCSKPRLDEFGGGAVVVTQDDAHYMNTWTCAKDTINQIKNGK